MEMENAAPSMDASNEVESAESQEQSQGEGSQQAEEKKAIAAQARRLSDADDDAIVTVKINGETKDLTVRELKKINQLENVSQAKMQEAARVMKQVQQIIGLAKSNPKEFLKKTGIDPYDFAEATLAEKFEMMNLTPEQREALETKQRLKSYEEKEKQDRERAEREQMSQAEAAESQRLDQEIGEAWRDSGLPKTKYMVAQIAARMLSASRQGLNLTAKEAAASVKEDFKMSAREIIGQLDAEAIQEIFGKDVMKKLREFDVKRVTGKPASQKMQSPGAKPASTQKKTFTSEHEWRDYLSKMAENLKD